LIVAPLPYVTDLTQSDQYGCVHFQPEEPSFGGNDETLEEKHKQMLQLHSYEGMTGADREEVFWTKKFFGLLHPASPEAHFKEKFESLLLEADVAATAADIQRTAALPDSPRLIIQGDKINPEKWMQSVEGDLVLGSSSDTFFEGLSALFAIYYTLNLEYQEGAASTMEFIQRGIMGINPGTGSKVGARKREKKSGMNPYVCTLISKLMDFEWLSL
ncbi:hypothetical protein NFI96_034101, partial [Prochilodus magdalenae]